MTMKSFYKNHVQKKMEKYVRKFFLKHSDVKLVVVTGSVGKTSTKTAIATILSEKYRIAMHEGNHNTQMSAPLSMLGIVYPEDVNKISSWWKVFRAARKRIKLPTGADIVVQELGSDRVGEIAHFGSYIRPDIAVITAVTPEHMESFQTMDNVAREELESANFSAQAIINRDDIDGEYAKYITNPEFTTYGTSGSGEYGFEIENFDIYNGYTIKLIAPEFNDEEVIAKVKVFGEHSLRPIIGAMVVAIKLGLSKEEIIRGIGNITPVNGRMNVLRGVQESFLIDDTYNSSPAAAVEAMRTLYDLPLTEKIAILGDMNELGTFSREEHTKLGMLCDPSQLTWVITVGQEANSYIASAARSKGCQVKECANALEAGAFAHKIIGDSGSVVLIKGSQGNVYLEEATKMLLHSNLEDRSLVRQSAEWMDIKNKYFSKF